jgi:hypothetical protein
MTSSNGSEWVPDGYTMLNRPWSAEEQERVQSSEDHRGEVLDWDHSTPDPGGPPITEPWPGLVIAAGGFPEPEDRGLATLTDLGVVEYVEDIIRPGRILVHAGTEGSGKTFADQELAIRVACAGGSFAGTWTVRQTGAVLVLSEMHVDDDFGREETVLDSLGLDRSELRGRYFRLPLLTAAGGPPALTVPQWRRWVVGWMREHGVVLLVIDTATGASQVDPWGRAIQAIYADLRVMLTEHPALSIVLVVHVRKPTGRADHGISSVIGEWGRWADIVLLQENDGDSLERSRLTLRKRVRRERRIVATKRGGLLVDPTDAATSSAKVPTADVLAAIEKRPGLSYAELGEELGVSKDTASRYVKALGDQVDTAPTGPRGQVRIFRTAAPPQTAA